MRADIAKIVGSMSPEQYEVFVSMYEKEQRRSPHHSSTARKLFGWMVE